MCAQCFNALPDISFRAVVGVMIHEDMNSGLNLASHLQGDRIVVRGRAPNCKVERDRRRGRKVAQMGAVVLTLPHVIAHYFELFWC